MHTSIEHHPRDGATMRRRRLMDIVAFVANRGPDGVHMMGLQAYMTILHGSRRDRVVEMVRDLQLAGYLHITAENMVKLTGKDLPKEWMGNE